MGAGGAAAGNERAAGAACCGRGAGAGAGAGCRTTGSLRASRSASPRPGARASTAHASRWRSVATCESQHATEQNTSRVRSRLQVDTLQTQCTAPNRIGFRHALHSIQTSPSRSTMATS